MRTCFIALFLCLLSIPAVKAQRLTLTFTNISMADALAAIARMSTDYRVQFIYDELEEFTVTTTIEDEDVPSAIRQVIGFYPVVMTVDGQDIFVECVRKERSKVSGTLVDEHGDPIPFANVSLLSPTDSTFVTGGVSNEAGCFVIPCGLNDVLLRITRLGYRSLFLNAQAGDMGNIMLEAEGVGLDEVEVDAKMPRYTMTAEGIQTNVEGTVLAKLGTLEDVLRHVPSVSKNEEDWEVMGFGTPLIYINGRKMYDLRELGRIKSEDVKSVELIRNPGAKYSSQYGAVLKIRTVRPQGEGFSVEATVFDGFKFNDGFKYNDVSELLTVKYRKNGLNAFLFYQNYIGKGMHEETYDATVKGDTLWHKDGSFHNISGNVLHNFHSGVFYDFNSEHSIGARYAFENLSHNYDDLSTATTLYANGDLYDYVTSNQHRKRGSWEHYLNAYYNGKAGNTTIDLNADYMQSEESVSYPVNEQSERFESEGLDITSANHSKMEAVKLALETPLLGGSLSYGGEFVFVNREDIYSSTRQEIIASSRDKVKESTTSLYAEYAHPTPIGTLTLGLRYEHVGMKYYENGVYMPTDSHTFDNVLPKFLLSTPIGKTTWQLSYSARTIRPTFTELSSNTSYENHYLLQQGNPLLKNQTEHVIDLAGMWKFLQCDISYKDSRNNVIQFADQLEGSQAVEHLTWQNVKSLKRIYATVSTAPEVGIWSPQMSAGVYKQWFRLHTGMGVFSLGKPMFDASMSNVFSLPWGITLNMDFSFKGKGHQANLEVLKNRYVLDVALRKSFLGDALVLQLRGSDLLHRDSWDALYYYDLMLDHFTSSYSNRYVSLILRYTFNQQKSQYKGTGAGSSVKNRLKTVYP